MDVVDVMAGVFCVVDDDVKPVWCRNIMMCNIHTDTTFTHIILQLFFYIHTHMHTDTHTHLVILLLTNYETRMNSINFKESHASTNN